MKDWTKAIAVGFLAPLAVCLFVLAFLWPMATMTPKDLPLAVVGTQEQVSKVSEAFEQKQPGLFEITPVEDRAAAVSLVEEHEAYGAIVLGQEPEVLTASAAGTAQGNIVKNLAQPVEAMANQQAQAMATAKGIPAEALPNVTVKTTDVVPTSSEDPQGLGMNMAVIPVAIGGMLGAAIPSFLLKRNSQRLLALVIFAPIAGLLATSVIGGVFGLLPASFWASTGVFTLGIAAVSSFILGLRALLGASGFGLGALTIMLVGNPLAGTMAPKEFVSGSWGYFGQFLPNGATATLLRLVNYFPAASISTQVWTLLAWVAFGLTLLGIGIVRESRSAKKAA
ncbi:hypothetical protein ACL1EU_10260 [Corynebacterium striatum]